MPAKPDPEFLEPLIAAARAADGQPPFSDQSLVDLRTGASTLVGLGLVALSEKAVAIVGEAGAELVVHPDARGAGLGTQLVERLINATTGTLRIWAHGDHPAARALAARYRFSAERRLLQLRAPVPAGRISTTTTFQPGDDTEWLRLNALAFAAHAEQGSVSQRDLDELKKEPWFNCDDFLVIRDGNTMLGYCWLKVEADIGEIYVLGVDPARQREGLGRRLMESGFARLEARGIHTAALYVEADNAAAVALYRSIGFTDHTVDVQYALHKTTAKLADG